MAWQTFRLIHIETISALRRCWLVVFALVIVQAAVAVRYDNGLASVLAHVVSTPLLLYLAVRSVVPRPGRDARDPHYDVFYAPLWGMVVTVAAGLVYVGLLLALAVSLLSMAKADFRWFYLTVVLAAWIAWLAVSVLFGFGFAAIAANNWDGPCAEWCRAARQRRWLVVRILIGPGPLLVLSVIVAAASGLYDGWSDAEPMPALQRAAVSLYVLSMQAYGIVSLGVLLAQAYLRDQDLGHETVEVFS